MPGTYDPETGLVYWGTAQAKPWARSARRTGGAAELYANSTLALDPRTGEIRWFYQHLPGESHDMDEAFERVLIDHDGRHSAFTMGKLGILWELDRVTGRFVRAVDLGYQTLVDVDPATGAVSYRPGMLSEVDEVIHFCPGTSGLKSLRAMAYDPGVGALFVPLQLNCQTASFNAGAGVSNRVNDFHSDSPEQLGELVALRVPTGERLWSTRRRAPFNTSALTTAGGVVFVGGWDGQALAYDSATGELLWQAPLPTMANGTPDQLRRGRSPVRRLHRRPQHGGFELGHDRPRGPAAGDRRAGGRLRRLCVRAAGVTAGIREQGTACTGRRRARGRGSIPIPSRRHGADRREGHRRPPLAQGQAGGAWPAQLHDFIFKAYGAGHPRQGSDLGQRRKP